MNRNSAFYIHRARGASSLEWELLPRLAVPDVFDACCLPADYFEARRLRIWPPRPTTSLKLHSLSPNALKMKALCLENGDPDDDPRLLKSSYNEDPSSIPLWGSLLDLRRGFLGDESGDSRDFDEN